MPYKTLLHFNGTDGSTTIVDDGTTPRTWGLIASEIDTAQSKFGGASWYCNRASANGAIYTSDFTDFDFANDFTFQCFYRPYATDSLHTLFCVQYADWGQRVQVNGTTLFLLVNGVNVISTTVGVFFETWCHVAWEKVSGTHYLYFNGVLQGTWVETEWSTDTLLYVTLGGRTIDGSTANSATDGWLEEVAISMGTAAYGSAFTPPTSELTNITVPQARSSSSGPLSSIESLAWSQFAISQASSPLGTLSATTFHDFTGQIDTATSTIYVMDLITPGGLVRVPISSWQATLQTDVQSYVQCVIPAATDWVPDIEAATEFVISRVGILLDGSSIEYEMARAPAQTVSLDGGAYNYTATVSGYTAAMDAVDDPSAALDRTLTGVRTVSRNSGNVRVRCNIDWLLRPGQRAYLDDEPIVVAYVNYYVPGFDQYMDIGDRA